MSKKLLCFLKKFTQLTKILHDRRSRRSRQIPSLNISFTNTFPFIRNSFWLHVMGRLTLAKYQTAVKVQFILDGCNYLALRIPPNINMRQDIIPFFPIVCFKTVLIGAGCFPLLLFKIYLQICSNSNLSIYVISVFHGPCSFCAQSHFKNFLHKQKIDLICTVMSQFLETNHSTSYMQSIMNTTVETIRH